MRGFSSAVSITLHLAVGGAVLVGTTKTGRSDPTHPREVHIVLPAVPKTDRDGGGGSTLPGPVTVAPPDTRSIPLPTTLPKTGALMPPFSPVYVGAMSSPGTGQPEGLGPMTEEHAEVLTGPLPAYPDLLRQAGIQGRVILEAVVDTTGRVLAQSISLISATNPGFVAPARQALLATLFRPAMMGGKAVRMRVRIPYEFAIRNGTGRAR